jgi:pimeloyl-ACP methyl ester carboxylesterase
MENTIIGTEQAVSIPCRRAILGGVLSIPKNATGIVIFAHGSGSSRYSRRNMYVANTLNCNGLATLLFDLLTQEEEEEERWTAHLRFNVRLLAERLVNATDWIKNRAETINLKIGYFGASTGAAAALIAAAGRPNLIQALVSRGGRPDLAETELERVRVPTLLIVGEKDNVVLNLNRDAFKKLKQVEDKRIIVIPNATHLFEEPGTLQQAAKVATDWLMVYLKD